MMTGKFLLPKVQETDSEQGITRSLKECVITIPKNVIDENYFLQAVQFHIFRIALVDTDAKLRMAEQKLENLKKEGKGADSIAYRKGQDNRNKLLVLLNLIRQEVSCMDTELAEEYEDANEVKKVFLQDSFAKVFAWTVGNYGSYSLYKTGDEATKGKLETIHLHVKNEDKILSLLKDFDFATTQETKKRAAKQIENFANETFSTNGGELYKNVSFKFSPEKVNRDLYSRSKKLMQHDGKGNLKDIEHSAFTMCMQLFLMCLVQLGVPTINGQKVVKVEEVATCSNELKVVRKKKEEKGKK